MKKSTIIFVVLFVLSCGFSREVHAQRGRASKFTEDKRKVKDKETENELKSLLQLEGISTGVGTKSEEMTLDIQTILSELRKPLFEIKVERPTIDVSLDDSKLGNIKLYIEEKANQTFYRIKIDEMAVEQMGK